MDLSCVRCYPGLTCEGPLLHADRCATGSLPTTPVPCPCTRWFAGRGEGFDYSALSLSLALAVDVQQFNRCQIARSILYCSIIIVGPSEEAKSQVQGSHEYELLNLPKRQRAKRKVL